MKWKKSWFSYAIWAVYSIVLGLYLAIYINAQCVLLKLNKYATIAAVCLTIVCIFGIYRLLCFAFEKGESKVSLCCHTQKMLEVFCVLSLLCAAVLLRVNRYCNHFTGCVGNQAFFEAAAIKEKGSIPFMQHGASYLYTGILSGWFSFLGNKQEAGLVLQAVLQILGILCFYFAIRNLVGKKEAVLSLAVMAVSPALLCSTFTLTPENLYFFLFSGMFFLISVYKRYEEKGRKTWAVCCFLVFLGIGCGYLVYLDILGILLLVAAFFVILSKKRKKGKNISYICFITVGALVGMFVLFLTVADGKNTTLIKEMSLWVGLFFYEFSWRCTMAGPDLTLAGNLFLLCLAGWSVFGFFRKREDDSSMYMLSVVILVFLVSFGEQNMSYQPLVTVYWAILASIGVACVMTPERKEETVKQKGKEKVEEQTVLDLEENENQIHFIENPLPLPKKHIKKTMDYGFLPGEELMKYDIEISDDDDFDLQ